MTDEEAVRRAIAEYSQHTDDGRFDDVAALFTADARFVALGVTHEGPSGVRGFLEQYQGPDIRAKHVTTNAIVDVDGDTARAWTDYIYVAQDLTILSAGRYHDTLVRGDDGRWRFSERRITFMGE